MAKIMYFFQNLSFKIIPFCVPPTTQGSAEESGVADLLEQKAFM